MNDRASTLNALKAMGYPVENITDVVPDEVLADLLTFLQAQGLKEPEPADAPPAPANAPPAPGDAAQFTDRNGKLVRGTVKQRNDEAAFLYEQLRSASAKGTAEAENRAKAAKVKIFRDEMTGIAQGVNVAFMTPHQFDSVQGLLMRCDDSAVKKFAEGKRAGSELDEAIHDLRTSHNVPVKSFTEKAPAGSAGGNETVRADVVRQMMGGFPAGKAMLAEREAAAKKV